MSTLRHTSPPPDTSKQPAKKPTWIVIIVVTAAVLLIVCASLTVITYKMNNNFSGRVNKKENTAQVGNDLAHTTVVFSRSSDTANSESSYQAIQEDRTDSNEVPHSMKNEGELPLTVPSTVYSTSIYMFQIKDRKNASKSAENEENENPAAAAAYSMRIHNTTYQTMYETTITNNTNDTYDYADQRELNTRELPRQSYGTPTVQQYETVQ
ncbi:hypothetical protein BSL78_19829 [Apostichopus japonicus]|uniref:Uncharacterized protein n=1 Tax=Stichopus japonicus TaxID=307972 RepID=A0A2G8K5R2_STIJA|nr:hypothetical protein BSL78_19829 [Apostichopus japonicus]